MGNSLIPTHLTDDELLTLRERLDPNGERTHAWLAVDYIHQNPGALARDVQERCNTSEALGSLIRNRRINERLAAFGLQLQCAKDAGEWVFRWYLCRTEPLFDEALADLLRRYPEARQRLPQYADELLAAEVTSALTPAERRRKADEKKRSQGLVRVSVWVPEYRKDEIMQIAGSWITSPG